MPKHAHSLEAIKQMLASDPMRVSKNVEAVGRQIIVACELAASIERAKIAAGLPASKRVPWPASTLEFLKRSAIVVRSH